MSTIISLQTILWSAFAAAAGIGLCVMLCIVAAAFVKVKIYIDVCLNVFSDMKKEPALQTLLVSHCRNRTYAMPFSLVVILLFLLDALFLCRRCLAAA